MPNLEARAVAIASLGIASVLASACALSAQAFAPGLLLLGYAVCAAVSYTCLTSEG